MNEFKNKIIPVYGVIFGIQIVFGIAGWFGLLSWLLVVPVLLLSVVALFYVSQKKHSVRRNFPVIGNIRYVFEAIRPEIMQYFIESDIDRRHIHRRISTTRVKTYAQIYTFRAKFLAQKDSYAVVKLPNLP